MKGIEVLEEVAIPVEDRTVGFVGDDQVEESDVEILELLDHCRVSPDVDPLGSVLVSVAPDDRSGFARQVLLEGFVRLLDQLATVAEKEYALGPFGTDHEIAESNRHPSLAGSGRLDKQGLPAA